MQTFLPYPDISRSAQALDWRRLGKQRVEAKQIHLALTGQSTGWIHHPAVKMWRGYEEALSWYGEVMCREWIFRGYRDNTLEYFVSRSGRIVFPPWFGDEAFHASHRSNLLRKDQLFYSQYEWSETPDLPYVWPVQ